MSGRHPIVAVDMTTTKTKRQMELKLACGHRITRRLTHPPEQIACPKCPRVKAV